MEDFAAEYVRIYCTYGNHQLYIQLLNQEHYVRFEILAVVIMKVTLL